MSTELTIKKLLPAVTYWKLSERNANILNITYVGIDWWISESTMLFNQKQT
jgi:molecular chaperone DnaK